MIGMIRIMGKQLFIILIILIILITPIIPRTPFTLNTPSHMTPPFSAP